MRHKYPREVAKLQELAPRGEYVTTEKIIDLMGWGHRTWCCKRTVAYIMKRAGAVLVRQDPYSYGGKTHSRSIWMFPFQLEE